MGFQPSEQAAVLRQRVLAFLDEHIYPNEHTLLEHSEESDRVQRELIEKAKAEGLWAMGHPESMGGLGLSWLDYAYINEIIGRSDAALDVFGSYSVQTCLMLDRAGTEAQKKEVLYPLADGDIHVAFSVTEPGAASSDPTNIETTARLEGDEWVINGRKWFVSGGERAAWFCVMCRTETDVESIHDAFSMILVPVPTPGFQLVRDINVMGLESNHPEYLFEDVRVPAGNLLGKRGQGFDLFQVRLGPARITNCMRWIGYAQRAFDLMCERINTRELRAGKRLADKQMMQMYVYESYTEITAARLAVLDAAERLDRGEQARVETSAIKASCAVMLNKVIDRALQVHGALGVSSDTPLERMYRMARIYRIVDGPDEVHIERVGKLILREYQREGNSWDFGLR
jgi:acyl-CoA dehydrogenase